MGKYIRRMMRLDNVTTIALYVLNLMAALIFILFVNYPEENFHQLDIYKMVKESYYVGAGIFIVLNITAFCFFFMKTQDHSRLALLIVIIVFLLLEIIVNSLIGIYFSFNPSWILAMQQATALILYMRRYFSIKISNQELADLKRQERDANI